MDRKLELFDTLPYDAKIFIRSKFLKANIVDLEIVDNLFKVELDENGNWISINSQNRLPEHVIPNVVKEKVHKLKRFEVEYKDENLDINEVRRIINSYRVILDHYLEMHIYSN